MWRTRGRGVLSAALTVALVAGTVLATGGVADAATPVSQSNGRFLSGVALNQNLDNVATVAGATATYPGTPTSVNPLSASVLNSVNLDLGGGINLLGNNGILTLGAVNQTATAAANGSSKAASGAVTDSGAIAIAGGVGSPPSNATLDLGSLANSVPAIKTAVTAGTLTVGATAATANESAAGAQSGTYAIAGLALNVTSPLVSNVPSTLKTTLGAVQPAVNGVPATLNGLGLGLVTVSPLPNLANLVDTLSPVTSADGSITANLNTGVVTIDVAKVLATAGLNLNSLPPNTELMPYITAALTSQLLPAITTALQGLTTTITNAINGITATVNVLGLQVPINAGVLSGVLSPVLAQALAPVNTAVSNLGSTVITPLAGGLTGLLSLEGNVQPTAPGAATTFTQRALTIGVIPTGHTATVNLASATVGPNAGPAAAPTTTSLNPNVGPAAGGTLVVISGANFVPGSTSVTIGGTAVPAGSVNVNAAGTTATFSTPPHAAGAVNDVSVTTPAGTSAPGLTFTYGPNAPVIPIAASLSPDHGPVAGATSVTIQGTGFIAGSTVNIGSSTGVVPTALSPTSLTFSTPPNAAGAVDVTVTNTNGTSSPALKYTYLDVPTTSGLSPDHGPVGGGTQVVITGTGFFPGDTTVSIGGATVAASDVLVNTAGTTATFSTPSHAAGLVGVTVTTVGGTSTPARGFTYGPPTTDAAGLSPDRGSVLGGTTVTVTGSGFVPGLTTVNIAGNPVVPTSVAADGNSLVFSTPVHGAAGVPVSVTTPGGTSTPDLTYTYLAVPTALSLNPPAGPTIGGTVVTVTGTGFVVGATSVSIGGNTVPAASVTVNTNGTTAMFSTPAHPVPGAVGVTLTTPGGTSPSLAFTYQPAPSAVSLSPGSGPIAGGTSVTVTGTGFVTGSAVKVDGVAVTPVTVASDGTSLTFLTPAHAAGGANVVVTNANGSSGPLLFTYVAVPTAASLAPTSGPVAGGTQVTVTGTGFVPGATTVRIGGIDLPASGVTVASGGTTAAFSTPGHVAGTVDVAVTTAGGTTTLPSSYTYVDVPTTAGIAPAFGPVAGGTQVTITGTGFVPGSTTVNIGTATGVPATVTNGGTTLTFTTPSTTTPGATPVTVTTPQGTTTPALTFVYGPPTTTGVLNPGRGPSTGGTVVTVTGTGFVPGATRVTIGGIIVGPAGVTVNNTGTSLTFTTPAHAPATVPVTVSTTGGTSAPSLAFVYDPLRAASLTPDHGPTTGNTSVTITGTGFVPGRTSVTIAGITVPAGLVMVNAAGTSAMFRTPAHAAGGVLVTATTPTGTTNPLGYLYGVAMLPVTSCVLTGVNPVTGLNAATVTVLADTGVATSLVPSTFAVQVGTLTAGSTRVTPLLGGFLQVSISVPVAVGTTSVDYGLAPQVTGVYSLVAGGPIPCTVITGPQKTAGAYHPLAPYRVLDTRSGNGASQPIGPGGTLKVRVRGLGGVPALGQPVGKGVATVMLNVTTTDSTKVGYLTIYPGGTRPGSSSINFPAKATVANLVAATVAADGTVSIYNGSLGVTDVVADVQGYFSDGDTVAPGSFVALSPSRILDTSTGTGAPKAPLKSGRTIKVKVTDLAGVPATNVAAVALNMTVAQPTGTGYLTVYPTDPKPYVSSLNFYKGATDANLVIVPVAPDGTITIYNGSTGSARVIADVSGFFRGGIAILDGEFVPVSPSRALDTRIKLNSTGKVGSYQSIAPQILGRNRIPATGVSAVVANLTVTSTKGPGYITAYPTNPVPLASNLNFVAKQDRPNAVISRIGTNGTVRLYNGSKLPVDLVTDVSGYFISNPAG